MISPSMSQVITKTEPAQRISSCSRLRAMLVPPAACVRRPCGSGNQQSEGWQEAKVEEVNDFQRTSLLVLAAYEESLEKPSREFPDEGRELLRRVKVVKKASYSETQDRCPPYLIVVDHDAKDVCVAVRGLNLAKVSEYMTLLDNRKGKQRFTEGYVHHGMLRSAGHLLDDEIEKLNSLMLTHKDYTLTLAGHSLGSGVVCLMALVMLRNLNELRGISKDRMRCHCFAPPRCVSLNLAVSCADIVSSVILQDDFLPRMNYPLETIFGFYLCLPCVLQWACCVDFFYPSTKFINDPRRLYPPGRLYHIIYTEGGKCIVAELPPDGRVAVPVDGRFEKLILSRTTHWDHLLTSIYAKLGGLMQAMSAKEEEWREVPAEQKMQRMETLRKDRVEDMVHALERAQSLHVPNVADPEAVLRAEEAEEGLRAAASKEEGAGEGATSAAKAAASAAEGDGKDGKAKDTGAAAVAAAAAAGAATAAVTGGEAAAASYAAGVPGPQEGEPAMTDREPAGTTPAGEPSAEKDSQPESQSSKRLPKAVVGKWSRLIDELIAAESVKAGEEQVGEEAAHGLAPKVQKMVRKWSLVRRAVNEGGLEEGSVKGRERDEGEKDERNDTPTGLQTVPEEPQAGQGS